MTKMASICLSLKGWLHWLRCRTTLRTVYFHLSHRLQDSKISLMDQTLAWGGVKMKHVATNMAQDLKICVANFCPTPVALIMHASLTEVSVLCLWDGDADVAVLLSTFPRLSIAYYTRWKNKCDFFLTPEPCS